MDQMGRPWSGYEEPAKGMWLWGKAGSRRSKDPGIKGFFKGQTVARRYSSLLFYMYQAVG